ncbi:MAG: rhomboid family intramembrane serine protease [Bacteroidales bacterium]
MFDKLKFNAFRIKYDKEQWRFITYAFLHADWIHLFINMYVLYSFGPAAERYFMYYFGTKGVFYFMLLYLGGIVFSVTPTFGRHKENLLYNAVGASGAISAVVFSIIIFNPFMRLSLIFLPFSFPAVLFGAAYLLYSYLMARKGDGPIGHDTHFWGGVFGIAFTVALKPAILLSFVQQIIQSLS